MLRELWRAAHFLRRRPPCPPRSGCALEKTVGIQVLVEIGSVDAVAGSGDAPARSLFRRGMEQASGALMVRPSRRSTLMVSSVMRTSLTRSPALGSEVAIPRLQEVPAVFQNQAFDPPKFFRREPQVVDHSNGIQPELRRQIVTVDVDVRRLLQVVAHEVDPVGTGGQPVSSRSPPAREPSNKPLASHSRPGELLRQPPGLSTAMG